MHRLTVTLVWLALVPACSARGESTHDRVRDLCSLTSMPSSSGQERTALIAEADKRFKAALSETTTLDAPDRAVLSATEELLSAGYVTTATGVPSHLTATLSDETARPIAAALVRLRASCR